MPPWYRFWNETIDDRKLRRIAQGTEQPLVTIIGSWSVIMALANNDHRRGYLMLADGLPYSHQDVISYMGVGLGDDETHEILKAFVDIRMVDIDEEEGAYYIPKFPERQFESDYSTPRVQDWRERKKSGGGQEKEKGASSESFLEIREYYIQLFCHDGYMPSPKAKPRKNNATMKKKAATRMKSAYFRDNWKKALEKAARSTFIANKGFFHLGWFLHNDDNWEKCLNGNYDDDREQHGRNRDQQRKGAAATHARQTGGADGQQALLEEFPEGFPVPGQ
jgi:hypothetical protein